MREVEKFQMNLKYYREKNGWSQQQLAEIINVSRPVITRLETGEQVPDLTYLLSLSNALHVSIDHLIGRDHQTNELLYEVDGRYHTEQQLSHIIDYLIKQPKMVTILNQLLLVKTKDRKIIEEMLMTIIEKSIKISE
ncbi:transcriptional regulator with XRE-family HTH domain [Metabacillus crassostreae]|uniref:helix-turn-helix domain-containing protein n=1 Tax=Metabacillus crassostreae TaxID=929098 RepID=UPI00195A858F|nr:helix-turn-helix transcriptional regulator [Metabacillus crassostreae]MBM7605360.1 transcriptional regulator with XRE-family HTH domain [Metabacillus crassostreae]